ncbi:ABC transporter permease subunit [Pseudomonas sp. v388]|uniref:ABC transporter permease n=1 Tax=Pseudomonas sp. v388 TaxID=2479849 RepID=UPI000F7A9713|nr:ABC transporter permease subunit [Pseudomonas sp. v388]RRV10494.1 ABC transporter permease subunit [Pseudomonas sp. v388]
MSEFFALLSFEPHGWGIPLLKGTWLTIRLAIATLPGGLVLGLLLALGMNCKHVLLNRLCTVFVTIFRGLPELLTIFIIYYGGQLLVREAATLLGSKSFEVDGFFAGMVALGLVFGAFSSEVFLTAIQAVAKGQSEAAHALGLSGIDRFRFVIAPQLWRIALPGLGNLWLVLLKETSLLSVISLSDLMRETYMAVASTKQPFFFYAFTCGIYLLLSLMSGQLLSRMEKRANRYYGRA